jgi:cyclophilin family peptidyl-prolyl cis-trans isomerase
MKKINWAVWVIITLTVFISISCKKEMDSLVVINTEFGDIEVLLYDQTPRHKENFLKLAKEKFYDGTAFHRVIRNFMIQGGDPNSKGGDPNTWGMGDPGYTIPAEIVPGLRHVQGVLAAARKGDMVNPRRESSGSQFYIVDSKAGAHHLDGQYTIFAKVVKGIEVVEKIAAQPTGRMDRPAKDIRMTMKVIEMPKKEITEKYGFEYPEAPGK